VVDLTRGICRYSIAPIVVTTVTVALLANAMPAILSLVAAARSTYEQIFK